MGAKIVKLINEDSTIEDNSSCDMRDLEQGEEEDSTTWDSSTSSSAAESLSDEDCTTQYKSGAFAEDPYIVEKRFVAGSNQYFYSIKKRK